MKLSKRAKRLEDGSIVIDEGDGAKVIAYRLEHPTNNERMKELAKRSGIFGVKSIRELKKLSGDPKVSDIVGNPFAFVVVGWNNENYGYFADACFFWTSMHLDALWEFVPVASWTKRYDKHHIEVSEKVKLPTCVRLFLKDYPEFKELFGEEK